MKYYLERAGDLDPNDVMKNSKEEYTRLQLRHNRLVAFFRDIKEDRKNQRDIYVDKAVQYLEPEDLRDEFKKLLKKFNESMDIVLPEPEALKYQFDFKLYNEIKLTAANLYMDKSLRISADESKKLQSLIDEHLRATGIQTLLDEPVSIIDADKFEQEIRKTKSTKSKELKIINRIRHKIKVELDKNPDFYKPLADKLEELIKQRKENRITQLGLFAEFDKIQLKIRNKSKEAENLGFSSEREFAVYKTLENKLDGDTRIITNAIYKSIEDELKIDSWDSKQTVLKSIRRKIKEILRNKVPDKELKNITVSILDVIRRND